MGDNDKPFACSDPGCGMRFANEDHLSVHKMKHQMSLTLTPGCKTGSLLSFVDQTPTPTKFLKNCEEIGLFNELSNNPFEEAFKKATKHPENLPLPSTSGILHTLHSQESLNTPTPLALQHLASVIISGADTLNTPNLLRHDSPPKDPPARVQDITYAPLPGPSAETGSTVGSTPGDETPQDTENSSQGFALASPGSGKRSLTTIAVPSAQSHPAPLILGPKAKRHRSGSNKSQGRVELDLESPAEKTEVANSRIVKLEPMSEVSSSDEMVIQEEEEVVVTQVEAPPEKVDSQLTSPVVEEMSPREASKSMPTLVSAASPVVPTIGLTKNQSQYLLQVMVQMPSGQMMPVHIPAAINDSTATPVAMPTVVVTKPQEAQTRTVPAAMSSPSASTSVSSTSASIKQRLKETIRQNAQHNILNDNMRVISDAAELAANDLVNYMPVSSPKGGVQVLQVKTVKTEGSASHQTAPQAQSRVQLQAADTSTPSTISSREFRKSKEQVDAEDRRQKFLERNRAAAARCRSKKKKVPTATLR